MSSKHPTADVEALMHPIREAEAALAKAEQFLGVLRLQRGQETASIHIGGRAVPLTEIDARTHMPVPVSGMQALRDAVIRVQVDHVQACRSRLEGLRYQLVRAAKAC